MLSLDGAAVYWLTQPLAGVGEDQAVQNKPAPRVTGPVKKPVKMPAKSAAVRAVPTTSSKPKPKKVPPPSAVRTDKPIDPPQKPDKIDDKPPPNARPAAVAVPAPPVPAPPTAVRADPGRNTVIAPPTRQVIAALPPAPPSAPLRQAPDPALVEISPKGPLPIVGRDGREAWRVYARPFDPFENRPRISVVLYGLGISGAATRTAIQGLPGAITLAFSPYADGLGNWIADARAAGHEILLMIPMEPRNYPDYDPGPQALLTSLTGPENTKRLEWMLGRGVGYVGVTDFMGSRFTNSTQHMRAFFRDLKKRGLMFLESRVSSRAVSGELAAASKVPFASSALYIDSRASRSAIDGQLAEAERLAKELGAVVVMGFLYPVTLERVAKWAATVERRGIALAPVSAIAKRRN